MLTIIKLYKFLGFALPRKQVLQKCRLVATLQRLGTNYISSQIFLLLGIFLSTCDNHTVSQLEKALFVKPFCLYTITPTTEGLNIILCKENCINRNKLHEKYK